MLLVTRQLIYEACLKCLWWYMWLHAYEKLLRVLSPGDLGAVPVQKQEWLGESTKGQRERVFPPSKVTGACVIITQHVLSNCPGFDF